MQKPGELKKPVRAGALQKDLKEFCSCPGLCLIHGVPKFRVQAKEKLQKDLKEFCSCPGLCLIHGVPKFRVQAKEKLQRRDEEPKE